ncbi:hypothetical protein C8Q74DRAFT_524525 [Fomes fomentarius]|nr:hypothetical protein C8Q74DRAFT_524525 [Fomes fomentarius]
MRAQGGVMESSTCVCIRTLGRGVLYQHSADEAGRSSVFGWAPGVSWYTSMDSGCPVCVSVSTRECKSSLESLGVWIPGRDGTDGGGPWNAQSPGPRTQNSEFRVLASGNQTAGCRWRIVLREYDSCVPFVAFIVSGCLLRRLVSPTRNV